MGMLDEAIREHFDLKRRNGADPAVVAIEEREALGDPAEREARASGIAADRSREIAEEEVDEVVVVAEEPGAVAIVEHEVVEEPAAILEEETVIIEPQEQEAAAVVEAEVVEEIVEEPELPQQETQAFTIEESQEAVMPEPPVRPVGAPPEAQPGGDATQGQQPEEAHDELEETPEFLEETPEHDRLWFERKPPRDFDF